MLPVLNSDPMGDADLTKTLASLLLKSTQRAPAPDSTPPRQNPAAREQMSLLFTAPLAPSPRTPRNSEPDDASPLVRPPQRAVSREPSHRIWKVRALVADVRETLEGSYDDVWVEGEISNCRPAPSGHIYFTLKDGDAQLALVLFRRQAQLLRFAPRDGMQVLARGRVSLYDSRGQLQLIAETLELRGAGSLQFAFEQLKARLLAEGLFDSARKRLLPAFPRCIGVITSTRGAVLHDIIRVVERRHAALDLTIYPAVMQGPDCPRTVTAGIEYFNLSASVDLILIARGGGSLEDLAGFNDEALARAIAVSNLPIVSAVGHETDFSIADLVADLRAPTPSAAAEMITAAQHRIEERVAGLTDRVQRAMQYHMVMARQNFTRLSAPQILARVRDGIDRRAQRIDDLRRRLDRSIERRLALSLRTVVSCTQRLQRHDPRTRLLATRHRWESAERALSPAAATRLAGAASRLKQAEVRLTALSPVAVLERGYALVYAADGSLLRSAHDVAPGGTIRARLATGSLTAEVLATDQS